MRPWSIAALTFAQALAQSAPGQVDLARIGHLAPKGRAQDRDWNPALPAVDALIRMGPRAVTFLVSKLEDESPVKGQAVDFWPDLRVGDLAWILLCDFFTRADWKRSTLEPPLDSILEDRNPDTPAWKTWAEQIQKDGRRSVRRKVENLLRPYQGNFAWDPQERCFRPGH